MTPANIGTVGQTPYANGRTYLHVPGMSCHALPCISDNFFSPYGFLDPQALSLVPQALPPHKIIVIDDL